MKKNAAKLIVLAALCAALLPGCKKSENKNASGAAAKEMTLYYSNSTDWADPIIQEFEDQTGIKVTLVQDGTSSLFARVKAEAANPQADVVWGGVTDTYRANQDMLQKYSHYGIFFEKRSP